MADFAIDLDKVLDDFEESEADTGATNGYSNSDYAFHNGSHSITASERYYPKFEPIDLDLSEADFGPACFTNTAHSNDVDEYGPSTRHLDSEQNASELNKLSMLNVKGYSNVSNINYHINLPTGDLKCKYDHNGDVACNSQVQAQMSDNHVADNTKDLTVISGDLVITSPTDLATSAENNSFSEMKVGSATMDDEKTVASTIDAATSLEFTCALIVDDVATSANADCIIVSRANESATLDIPGLNDYSQLDAKCNVSSPYTDPSNSASVVESAQSDVAAGFGSNMADSTSTQLRLLSGACIEAAEVANLAANSSSRIREVDVLQETTSIPATYATTEAGTEKRLDVAATLTEDAQAVDNGAAFNSELDSVVEAAATIEASFREILDESKVFGELKTPDSLEYVLGEQHNQTDCETLDRMISDVVVSTDSGNSTDNIGDVKLREKQLIITDDDQLHVLSSGDDAISGQCLEDAVYSKHSDVVPDINIATTCLPDSESQHLAEEQPRKASSFKDAERTTCDQTVGFSEDFSMEELDVDAYLRDITTNVVYNDSQAQEPLDLVGYDHSEIMHQTNEGQAVEEPFSMYDSLHAASCAVTNHVAIDPTVQTAANFGESMYQEMMRRNSGDNISGVEFSAPGRLERSTEQAVQGDESVLCDAEQLQDFEINLTEVARQGENVDELINDIVSRAVEGLAELSHIKGEEEQSETREWCIDSQADLKPMYCNFSTDGQNESTHLPCGLNTSHPAFGGSPENVSLMAQCEHPSAIKTLSKVAASSSLNNSNAVSSDLHTPPKLTMEATAGDIAAVTICDSAATEKSISTRRSVEKHAVINRETPQFVGIAAVSSPASSSDSTEVWQPSVRGVDGRDSCSSNSGTEANVGTSAQNGSTVESDLPPVYSLVSPDAQGQPTPVSAARPDVMTSSRDEPVPYISSAWARTDPPRCANISLSILELGKISPKWIPDTDALKCMACELVFSFTKRRHHCRACGKVFCSVCCSLKVALQYLENKEARVCSNCFQDLLRAHSFELMHPEAQLNHSGSSLDGSNIHQQMAAAAGGGQTDGTTAASLSFIPPVGVLRKQGSLKVQGEQKQVMFSDGVRPGGDLSELDGHSSDPRPSLTANYRRTKKLDRLGGASITGRETTRGISLVPAAGLPPVVVLSAGGRDVSIESNPNPESVMKQIRSTDGVDPVTFSINGNLVVMVKIIQLDCCVQRICWCFTTKGLCLVGQDEIVLLLECLPNESEIPVDIFKHLALIYNEAEQGNVVSHLGFTPLPPGSLGTNEPSGFLYTRATFQCLRKIMIPEPPYLFAILLHKWEIPWAKVFPLRLMLRFGAEFKYYPCPLFGVRGRKPVYGEIGHTIMNLLSDFTNYRYTLPKISGLVVHMTDKKTTIRLPRHSYDMVMKVMSSSDESVMAFGASFSLEADSHLVCLQNDDGNYRTQAINIQDRPRNVTGACFVVFNGALKSSSGVLAKSSIVEDGLMVQISLESMTALKLSLSDMKDYMIACGPAGLENPDEVVVVEWTSDMPVDINPGVRSPIDLMSLEDVESVRVHSSTDYAGVTHTIRWTELFLLRHDIIERSHADQADVSQIAEMLAQACCFALTSHLEQLAFEMMTRIGLRVTIDSEQVGYEVGSQGRRLPDVCMNELDEKLIPIIHGAVSSSRPATVLELIFYVFRSNFTLAAKTSSPPQSSSLV